MHELFVIVAYRHIFYAVSERTKPSRSAQNVVQYCIGHSGIMITLR